MLHMIEHVFIEQSLVAAFAVVGAVMWISLAISKRFTAGRVHGSAIAIVMGLALAYGGGLMTAGQKGLADIPVFAGIGLMGGAMLRDFAIVATALVGTPFVARMIGLDKPRSAMAFGGLMGTVSGVAGGLAATDPKLVPYGALTATFHTGIGCLVGPSILYLGMRALLG